MAEPSARKAASPLVVALRQALEEIAVRKAAEKAERRAKITIVQGGRRNAA